MCGLLPEKDQLYGITSYDKYRKIKKRKLNCGHIENYYLWASYKRK
jgi:hypothetical protein